jgi:hypothetical protein
VTGHGRTRGPPGTARLCIEQGFESLTDGRALLRRRESLDTLGEIRDETAKIVSAESRRIGAHTTRLRQHDRPRERSELREHAEDALREGAEIDPVWQAARYSFHDAFSRASCSSSLAAGAMMNSQFASPRAVHRTSRPCTSTPNASLHQPAEYPALNKQAQ